MRPRWKKHGNQLHFLQLDSSVLLYRMRLSVFSLVSHSKNMLKSFLVFILVFLSFSVCSLTFATCENADTTSPVEFLKNCSSASSDTAVITKGTGRDWVKDLVKTVAERVIGFGVLFAIGAIVFAGIRYTTSAWDDEKIKSAKNTLIYAVVWFTLLLVAFPLVDVIIGFIYGFWW